MQGPQERDLHNGTIENIMGEAVAKVCKIAEERELSLRDAAYNVAINRINHGVDIVGMTI
jgi:glutamate dehydrogenase/leucine dehydrogenase